MKENGSLKERVALLEARLSTLEKRSLEQQELDVEPRLDRLEEILFLTQIHSFGDLIKLRFSELSKTLKKISGYIIFEDRHFELRLKRLKRLYRGDKCQDQTDNRNLSNSNNRLFIDITQTVSSDKITGISRVSKELVVAAMDHGIVPVFQWGSNYISYSFALNAYEKVRISKGDILFFPDASWLCPNLKENITKAKMKGAKIAFLIHDIIPIRYPHFCDPQHNELFIKWLTEIVFDSDCIIGVSRSVAEDVKKYMDQIELPELRRPSIRWSHSGVGTLATGLDELPHPEIDWDVSDPIYLSVGAIEPKKNYSVILDAIDKAWSDGAQFNYVIVGSYGWGQAHVRDRIVNHSDYGKRLHWRQGISDTQLGYLYNKSHYLIQASIAEGFGLPVIEAAQYRLPVICSDIPVLREIAQDKALYFHFDDSDDLANTIKATSGQEKKFCDIPFDTWEYSALRTVKILNQI